MKKAYIFIKFFGILCLLSQCYSQNELSDNENTFSINISHNYETNDDKETKEDNG